MTTDTLLFIFAFQFRFSSVNLIFSLVNPILFPFSQIFSLVFSF
jgi:hypothetical protein